MFNFFYLFYFFVHVVNYHQPISYIKRILQCHYFYSQKVRTTTHRILYLCIPTCTCHSCVFGVNIYVVFTYLKCLIPDTPRVGV